MLAECIEELKKNLSDCVQLGIWNHEAFSIFTIKSMRWALPLKAAVKYGGISNNYLKSLI